MVKDAVGWDVWDVYMWENDMWENRIGIRLKTGVRARRNIIQSCNIRAARGSGL